jgi:hypothetical protein
MNSFSSGEREKEKKESGEVFSTCLGYNISARTT